MKYLNDLTQLGGKVFEVGGSVRDRILNRKRKDLDLLVTGLAIETITKALKPYGKVTLVGKTFGVLKFYPYAKNRNLLKPQSGAEGEAPPALPVEGATRAPTIDIALPRKEVSTGSGHRDFTVEFDKNLSVEEDLGRRDFTINAMAYDIAEDKIIDPFGGQKDLKKKILRQVFENSFTEDPLRLLRAIQFAARFNLTIEPATLDSIRRNARLISSISGERIIEELKKLMHAKEPSLGFNLMLDTGILKYCLPEVEATKGISQAKQAGDDVFRHTMKVLDASRMDEAIDNAGDMELMFATLLHDIGKARTKKYSEKDKRVVFFGHQIVSARMARRILDRLKSQTIGIDPNIVCTLIEHHMFETKAFYSEKAIRRFISKVGKDLIYRLIDLRLADNRGGKYPAGIKGVLKLKAKITEEINRKVPFGTSDLAISGTDIIELGIPEGPMVGKVLKDLVEVVLDDPELNTKEQLIAISKNILDSAEILPLRKRGQGGFYNK